MSKTLLLADDSVVIQKLVGLSFANEAVELITTDNGDDAVARAREAKPDLILADVVMPGRNGYEVCEAIKQDPELSHIPVLLLTGTFEAFDDARATEVGSSGHITKPFEAQVLVERVNALLEQGATSGSTAASGGAPTGDDAYEFFESEPSAAAAPATTETVSVPNSDPTPGGDFVGADQAFSFDNDAANLEPLDAATGFDEFSGSTTSPQSEPGGDRTVAMIPDEPTPASSLDFDALDATPFNEDSDLESFSSSDPNELAETQLVGDPFGDGEPDLSFHEDISDPSVSSALSFGDHASNPFSAGKLDPSDTLLANDLFEEPKTAASEAAPTKPDATDSQAITPVTPIGAFDLEASEAPLLESSQPGIEAIDEETPFEVPSPESDAPEAHVQDEFSSGSSEAAEQWVSEVEPVAGLELEAPAMDADPAPAVHAEPESQGIPLATETAAAGTPDLSPMLRERLHESLEKIAWEAFADVSDQIVKQALERIESVAWEVIPQMAEAMIQEEIRRMKGDPEE